MNEAQWLEARQSGIGGSEIGAIAGLSKYESPYSIWARKVHNVNAFDGNEATDLGHLLEPSVALAYAREFHAAVVEWPVILRSKVHTFLSANVDRFIVEPSDQFPAGEVTVWKSETPPPGIICLLECKTGALASPGSPSDWFTDVGIPMGYSCQGYWYLAATGFDQIEYACLLGGHGMQYRTQYRDDDIIDDLLTIAERFWNDHVLTGVPPEVDGSNSTEDAQKALYPQSVENKTVEGGAELAFLLAELKEAKAATSAAEDYQKGVRAKIVDIIGDAEIATVDGQVVATFKTGKEREFFADKIFKESHPDLYREFLRPKPGVRTLRAKD